MLENAIVEAVLSILGIVLTGVFGYVGKVAAKSIKDHHAELIAKRAVAFVEETFKELDGKNRFYKAADYLANELQKIGVKKIDEKDIQVLIQSAYKRMKDEVNQAIEDQQEEPQEPTDQPKNEPQPEQVTSNDQAYRQALADKVRENQKSVADMTMDDLKNAIADVINKQPVQSAPQQPQNVPLPK